MSRRYAYDETFLAGRRASVNVRFVQRLRRFTSAATAVLILLAVPACVKTGGEPATAECKAAMKAYSDALAGFGGKPIRPTVHERLQRATLDACTPGGWLDAVEPYSEANEPGRIAIAEPRKVLEAMCEGLEPTPKACE